MHVAVNAWFWNSPTTGSGQYVRHLVETMASMAADVRWSLIVPSTDDALTKKLPANVLFVPAMEHPGGTGNLGKVWFEQVVFPRRCRQLRADIAHVPYWASPLFPSIPTLVTIHDLIPLLLPEYRGGGLVRLYTALVSRSARKARMVLTDSEASRRDILAHLQVRDVRAIPLAVEPHYTPVAHPDDEAIRARYGLPRRYVLYLGACDVRKNLAAVVAAYRHAGPAVVAKYPLVIAGRLPDADTPFTPDPHRLAREQGLPADAVRFPGPPRDADKAALYRSALAFLFPSRYEGFGLPVLEALACGSPVIASAASAVPEVVGDAGVLLEADDAPGMGLALAHLAADPEHRATLSRRAVARAARFSWERTAGQTLAAYRAILV